MTLGVADTPKFKSKLWASLSALSGLINSIFSIFGSMGVWAWTFFSFGGSLGISFSIKSFCISSMFVKTMFFALVWWRENASFSDFMDVLS